MKQHPIPQNILDIEFKLFTKFTIREFVYMAVGVGFGGIFLLLYTKAVLPGVIAIPIFLISSGLGLFLGLVPINDQKADVFLKNYFLAITRPTQRVWKNEQFDEKVNWIAQGKGISLTTGTMDRDQANNVKPGRIIGGTAQPISSSQFIEETTLKQIDQEELLKIQEIENAAIEASQIQLAPVLDLNIPDSTVTQNPETTNTIQSTIDSQALSNNTFILNPQATQTTDINQSEQSSQMNSVQPENTDNTDISNPSDFMNILKPHPSNHISENDLLIEQNIAPITGGGDSDVITQQIPNLDQTDNSNMIQEQISAGNIDTIQSVENAIPTTISTPAIGPVQNTSSSVSAENLITITKDTANAFKTQVEDFQTETGNISLYLTDKAGNPLPQTLLMIKDAKKSVVQVHVSDPQGLVLNKHTLPEGFYTIEIKNDNHSFPMVNYILEGEPIPVVNIKSLN